MAHFKWMHFACPGDRSDIMVRQIKKRRTCVCVGGGGGAGGTFIYIYIFPPFESFSLFPFCLSPGFFFPFNDLQGHILCIQFQIEPYWGKKHTSEHRFNARTRVWNTPLKSSCTRLLKFTRKTPTLKHSHTQPCVCVCVSVRWRT